MRLDFNVLWVDDQPDRIDAQISAIKTTMREEGFEFCPTKCQTINEVKARISDYIFCDEIDLILVDWDLGNNIKGQDAIREIREKVPYKDVVFYSAMTEADKLRELVFNYKLEGVFCTRREELVDEVRGVFESLVKKVLDLDHTRGIVMGATSDIDLIASQCLRALHGSLGEEDQESFLKDALQRITNKIEKMKADSESLHASPDFPSLLRHHMLFSANDRLRMLSSVLKQHDRGNEFRSALTLYMEEVVPKRNMLGHQVLATSTRSLVKIDDGEKEFTVGEMRQLRCMLLDLRGKFRDLHAILNG